MWRSSNKASAKLVKCLQKEAAAPVTHFRPHDPRSSAVPYSWMVLTGWIAPASPCSRKGARVIHDPTAVSPTGIAWQQAVGVVGVDAGQVTRPAQEMVPVHTVPAHCRDCGIEWGSRGQDGGGVSLGGNRGCRAGQPPYWGLPLRCHSMVWVGRCAPIQSGPLWVQPLAPSTRRTPWSRAKTRLRRGGHGGGVGWVG